MAEQPTARQQLANLLAGALDGGGIGGLLPEGSEIRKRIAEYKPPPPDPRVEHEREARKRLARAFADGLDNAGADGGTVSVRRTATAQELAQEADARARQKAEREAGAAREAKLDADAKAASEQIAALEKRIAQAERTARNDAIKAEMGRIAADRARRGKKPLETGELWSRAAMSLARSGSLR